MCQEKGRTGKAALNSDAQGGNEAGLAARATPPSAPQSTNRHSQGLPPLVASSVFLCGTSDLRAPMRASNGHSSFRKKNR
jgi:hypothetical protein